MDTRRFAPALLLLAVCSPLPAEAGAHIEALEGGARFKVTFKHQPVIACQRVTVAGSFNGWNKATNPLADPDGDGTYTLTLVLPRGRHAYKFVINDSVWTQDADNPLAEGDGHSGHNSILDLGSQRTGAVGQRGDGRIALEEFIHDPEDLAYVCAIDGRRRLVVRLHVLSDDVEGVRVEALPKPLAGTRTGADDTVPARRIARFEGRDVYEARLTWDAAPGKVRYVFHLDDGGESARFPPEHKRFTTSMAHAGRFPTPEWVRDAVFYQIFPDRFADGDPEARSSLPARPQGKPWDINDRFAEDWGSQPSYFNFMGGDLAGIQDKADYLQELGFNAIYLNPIFAAGSNHRYDASDYERVDPALGTMEDFRSLRDALSERGVRLILDCVFNHTGDTHYAFQDAMQKGPKSRYWDWYFFDGGFPVVQTPKPNYRAWWGFGSLPQLNTRNPEVVKHLLGVGLQWLREGSSGWRLDVPNELDAVNPEFWPEFRRRVKQQDPEAYIVGEIWTDARSWLRGDKFDAVMNYPVRDAAIEFIVKGEIDGAGFAEKLSHQLATYPEAAVQVQFNLLGSHDTARIRSVANGDLRKVRLAQTFLYGYPGAPVIYYGDEIGMLGGKDPACRGTFPWDRPREQCDQTLAHVRRLGELRQAERALRRGTLRFLPTEGRVCAFVREPEAGEAGRPVVVVLNAANHARTLSLPAPDLSGTPVELLEARQVRWNASGELELELPAMGGAMIALVR